LLRVPTIPGAAHFSPGFGPPIPDTGATMDPVDRPWPIREVPMRRSPFALAAMLAALALAAPRPAQATLHAGDPAPDFRGTDLDGVSHHLTDFRGKVVILFVLGSS